VTDLDLIVVITFESEDAMHKSMRRRRADGLREIIEADKNKFRDMSKVKVVRIAEANVRSTVNDERGRLLLTIV
jgi:hypothetical protein